MILESNIPSLVSLNLLNSFKKRQYAREASHFISFPNSLNKYDKTRALM